MKRFINIILYLISVHVSALIFTSLFRLGLFITAHHHLSAEGMTHVWLSVRAFVNGLWFDNVIGCYILLLPLALALVFSVFKFYRLNIFRFFTFYFGLFYGLIFLISASDIPYFNYFFKHINSSIFEWTGYLGTTLGMVFTEKSYYGAIGLFLLLLICFLIWLVRLSRFFYRRYTVAVHSLSARQLIPVGISWTVLIGLCIFGIRGRMGYNPIKVSAAYFCKDAMLNQLGVSPTFNLLTSVLDDFRPENKHLGIMDETEALRLAQSFLNRPGIDGISPLAVQRQNPRSVVDSLPQQPNVVFLIVESLSSHLMEHFGNSQSLTPFIDSLYTHSLSFRNFYSAGIHTNCGLYSSLYSFPAIMKRNMMKGSVIPTYSGLPTVLKEKGYYNLFFMTHEGQYDNMNAFFRTNGFDEVYSQENYPKDKVVNSFGVPDDYLYTYALQVLNKQASLARPFFATLLSISNHPPYVIPSYFHPSTAEPETQIVEYTDWAIQNFFKEASKQSWFSHTIFVIEGDHGKLVGKAECELPQSYNHVPLLIFGPGITPEERTEFGGQIDVQPTLLGLLGIDYVQNNFGVNLLEEERPCMFYTADNMIAARDAHRLYLYNYETNQEFTYELNDNSLTPASFDKGFELLKQYSFSMLQAAEYLVKNKKTVNTNRPNS